MIPVLPGRLDGLGLMDEGEPGAGAPAASGWFSRLGVSGRPSEAAGRKGTEEHA